MTDKDALEFLKIEYMSESDRTLICKFSSKESHESFLINGDNQIIKLNSGIKISKSMTINSQHSLEDVVVRIPKNTYNVEVFLIFRNQVPGIVVLSKKVIDIEISIEVPGNPTLCEYSFITKTIEHQDDARKVNEEIELRAVKQEYKIKNVTSIFKKVTSSLSCYIDSLK